MDSNVRKQITCHRMHRPNIDIERIYDKKENGGRGLIKVELTYKTTTIGEEKYLETIADAAVSKHT